MKYTNASKWLSVILVIAVMIPVIGCGKEEAQEPTPTPTPTSIITSEPISTPTPTPIPSTTFEPTATSTTEPTAEPTSEPTPTPSQPSDTELQGTWTAETGTLPACTFTFSGNNYTMSTLTIEHLTGDVIMSGTFTLDSTSNPKTIDLYVAIAPELVYQTSFSQYVGKTALCIYLISGTNLSLAMGEPGTGERPTSFTDTEGIMMEGGMLFNLVKQ